MMPIELVTGDDGAAQSVDPVIENIAALKALFPQAFGEGKIDFDILRQLLGDAVDDGDERYGLNWSGKRAARRLALTPSAGTLRPAKADSVDWDTTQNLMIEGDNLEVLKLLQKSYAGKVKLIYIDPPYNTGNDFVYPDDYKDSIGNYMRRTGQTDEHGVKNSSNPESSGRYHTDWLNMIYPRVLNAWKFLSPDGMLVISINDAESWRVKAMLDDVFGEENFIAQLVWKARVSEDTRAINGVSTDHEYLICYGRSEAATFRGAEKDETKFDNRDNDTRGPWRSADLTGLAGPAARPNLHYDLINPATGINYGCPPKGWRYEPSTMEKKIAEGRILFPTESTGRPRHKLFLNEIENQFKNMTSVLTSASTADGTREANVLLGPSVFSFPKPVNLLKLLVEQATTEEHVILDFFAGSGTTGHAVMAQNATDGGNRRYILVQLPEPLSPANRDQKTAADFCDQHGKPRTIAELTKERLRRVGAKIKDENPLFIGDTGFRTYKLSTSNIRAWNPGDDLAGDIEAHISNLLPDRSEDDLLTELLLKTGLDLTTPMQTRVLGNKNAQCFGGGALITCFADISEAEGESLADGLASWHAELAPETMTTIFFRDTGFASNQAKLNLSAILEQRIGDKRLRLRSL
jgi:adenine-specific DNA-methyltransferase